GEVDLENLTSIAYETTNQVFNETIKAYDANVVPMSLEDMLDVVEHPAIKAAIENIDAMNGSPLAIEMAYKVAKDILKDPNELPGNPIAAAIRSNLTKMDQ